MKKAILLGLIFITHLLFAISASAGPIIVEDSSATWEPNLTLTDFPPPLSPRIIGEYTSIMHTEPLRVSEEMLIQTLYARPRIVVEYATTIGRLVLDTVPMCRSDILRDGRVDQFDLDLLAFDFSRSDCVDDCPADMAPDGDVDGVDIAIMAAEFGNENCPFMD